MFGPLGVMEILFILVLALLIFGPRRLPEVGRTLGKALGEFRRATTDLKRTINTELALEDQEERPTTGRRPASLSSTTGEAAGSESPTVRSAEGSHPRSPRRSPVPAEGTTTAPGPAPVEPVAGGDRDPEPDSAGREDGE